MWCNNCQKEIKDCTCENLEKRLNEAVKGGHFDYKICKLCGKHYARCRCTVPSFVLASIYIKPKEEKKSTMKEIHICEGFNFRKIPEGKLIDDFENYKWEIVATSIASPERDR